MIASRTSPPTRIAVTGASGLIGTALCLQLESSGHEVVRLVRRQATNRNEVTWDPARGTLNTEALAGVVAVVHLAGENLSGGRWTSARRRRIRDSRIAGTRLLATVLANLNVTPRALICASAIGFYGDRGDDILTEASPKGEGFLADLVADWEAAADPARQAGIRVVSVRTGIVLTPLGGALKLMLPPFRLGLGGPLGSGRHWMSWISLDDVVGVLLAAIENDTWRGPVNAVTDSPVRNWEFAEVLAGVLRRPAVLRVPASALDLLLGDLAREAVLASTRVLPAQLEAWGHALEDHELGPTLRRLVE